MDRSLKIIGEVLLRFAAAIVGFFVLFGTYLFLFVAHIGKSIGLTEVFSVSLRTLLLPFIDLHRSVIILIKFLRSPDVSETRVEHTEVLHAITVSLTTEVILFILLIVAIFFFERSSRTRTATIFFYVFMPALLWLLWSELYLFI